MRRWITAHRERFIWRQPDPTGLYRRNDSFSAQKIGKPNSTHSEVALQRPRETFGMGLAGRQSPPSKKTQSVV